MSKRPEPEPTFLKSIMLERWKTFTRVADRERRSERLRVAKQKGTHTRREWEILRDVIGVCVVCRTPFGLTRDHIIPLFVGGCDCIANIQPACQSCNSAGIGQDLRSNAREDWGIAFTSRLEAEGQRP